MCDVVTMIRKKEECIPLKCQETLHQYNRQDYFIMHLCYKNQDGGGDSSVVRAPDS